MKALESLLDSQAHLFEKGGKFEIMRRFTKRRTRCCSPGTGDEG